MHITYWAMPAPDMTEMRAESSSSGRCKVLSFLTSAYTGVAAIEPLHA